MSVYMFIGIPLTIHALNLIKYEDEEHKIHNFHLCTRTCPKWQLIGMTMKKSMKELEEIKNEYDGLNELCWLHLMENWILEDNKSSRYSCTWEGLYNLLKDSQIPKSTLKRLKKAVTHAECQPLPESSLAQSSEFFLF